MLATPELNTRRTFTAASMAVDLLTGGSLLNKLEAAVRSGTKHRVIFCNVSTVVECQENEALREAVGTAEIVSPDGMPLVWLARLKGQTGIERVDGPSFMKASMAWGVQHGWRHYLYGGSDKVLPRLIENLRTEMPDLQIAGSDSPPFRELTDDEKAAAVGRINASDADLVWVGLGMPKQEIWMAHHQSLLNAPVLLGVGAAFDFHGGSKRRAPVWMQRSGLEWSYRLAQEPGRLWKRYLMGNGRFLYLVGKEAVQAPVKRLRRPR
jgi:N-acetylglucosaminyldiphosphoundecaprenol N-acetyl-beta-D-mannosaminyltransferase